MPNWCENEVQISGKTEDVKKFLEKIDYRGQNFLFNGIRPIPIELTQIQYGGREINGQYVKEWIDYGGDNVKALTQEDATRLLNEYGATNWYDWCVKYWGTKWEPSNVYYVSTLDERYEYSSITVHFETAWNPPDELYNYLLQIHPELSFEWFYKESGQQIAGWL